jgi:selenocysteine-specific elongation factor
MTTLGGGNVVETKAKRHRRRHSPTLEKLKSLQYGSPSEIVLSIVNSNTSCSFNWLLSHSSFDEKELADIIKKLTEENSLISTIPNISKSFFFSKDRWEHMLGVTNETLESFHRQFPLRQGIQREELRNKLVLSPESFNSVVNVLEEKKLVKDFNSLISIYAHKPYLTKEQIQLSESFVAHIAKGGFSPRTDLEVDHDILNFLIENKEVVQVADGIVFSTSIFEEMVIGLRTYISQNGEITVGDFRDLYKTSRKYALAVMDYLDQQQITKRVGDARILRE